jgi:glucose-1-phosphate thymidylyltransferase
MFKERIATNSLEIRGVVLGGGRGTRLYPLTAETSKHLLPIGDRPLIVRVIEQLLAADIKDILLLIDQRFASQFMEILKDGSHLGVRSLAYIWQPPEGKGLPTAISQVKPFIKDGKIIVACGDVLIENGIRNPVEDFIKQDTGARLTGVFAKDTAGYSPLEVNDEIVRKILPKDKNRHEPGLIDLGIYMYHPDVFYHISHLIPSVRGETEIWDLNQRYADQGKLNVTVIDGWWSDVGGSIETYFEAYEKYKAK